VPNNVVLIGFSGTGKSHVGRALADRLGWRLLDTDARLVERFGCSIGDYFRTRGEPAFRAAEHEELARACAGEQQVIAVGGGAVVAPESWAVAERGNLVVRLRASPETIWRRLNAVPGAEERPMLSGDDPRGRMARLLAEREPVYARAHVTVDTDDRTVDDVVDAIAAAVDRFLAAGGRSDERNSEESALPCGTRVPVLDGAATFPRSAPNSEPALDGSAEWR
jgi:shikimate kinase